MTVREQLLEVLLDQPEAGPLERTWDGEWYRRGCYDDGSPLGSAQNEGRELPSLSRRAAR